MDGLNNAMHASRIMIFVYIHVHVFASIYKLHFAAHTVSTDIIDIDWHLALELVYMYNCTNLHLFVSIKIYV